jgi:hypothetical protein
VFGISDQKPEENAHGLSESDEDVSYRGLLRKVEHIAAVELKPLMDKMLAQPLESTKLAGLTIDYSTVQAQESVAIGLLRRFAREQRLKLRIEDFPYLRFADWLLTFSLRVSPSTFRKYKSYVVDYLCGLPYDEAGEAVNIIVNGGIDDLEDDDPGVPESQTGVRRPHIIKEFPLADFQKVIGFLRFRSRSQYAGDMANLLEASIMTGLRPIDWKVATIVGFDNQTAGCRRRNWLFVANAKATNGRGNGLLRSMDVSEFSDDMINAIRETINIARGFDAQGEFELQFREKFIKMMYRITKQLWPDDDGKAYSLYSCRHQAISNWRASMSALDVAALSGHAVTRTALKHYGVKKSAWPKSDLSSSARPNPEEVRRIEQRMAMFRHFESFTMPDQKEEMHTPSRSTPDPGK